MSMNVGVRHSERAPAPLFPPLVTAAVYALPVVLALAIVALLGTAGLLTALGVMAWSELLLRVGNRTFIGQRRVDRVMAPAVVISFTSHRTDPMLGWALRPDETTINSFTIPRKRLELRYTVTTDEQGRRITSKRSPSGRPMSIYGCSNTFGWGLEDHQTYPWLLQERFPNGPVYNYGVSGYSLYQILLRMEDTLPEDRPKVVVIGFSPGLEARSVNDSTYLRAVSEYGGVPPSALSVQRNGRPRVLKRYAPEAYWHLPGADQLMLAGLAERGLNRVRFRGREGENNKRSTTQHLLLSMDHLCRRHDARFLVQYLTSDTRYRRFLSNSDVNWAPGPIDMDECTPEGAYKYRLDPFDGHPNSKANQHYADTLEPVIKEMLETGRFTPKPGALPPNHQDESTAAAIYPVF